MKKQLLIGLVVVLASGSAHAGPESCSSVSVEHDNGDRYQVVLNNRCDRDVYLSYCYTNNHGGKWRGRGAADPSAVAKGAFYSPAAEIEHRLGWSWNETRLPNCQ